MSDPAQIRACVVLYAEDDPNDVFFMRRGFSKMGGVRLHIVEHGGAAIDYLSGAGAYGDRTQYPLPTLLILDVKMPECSGLEVLAWVRARDEFATLPVVMFTSSTQGSDVAESRRLGADGYFVKPSNAMNLARLMESIVTKAQVPRAGAERATFDLQENVFGSTP